MLPLFPATVPGHPELVVLLFIFVIGFVPLVVLLAGVYLFGKSRGKAQALEHQDSGDER